jgi:hypothetical protein
MQLSASAISASPDFLPTTAGSLCLTPHLGCFERVSGALASLWWHAGEAAQTMAGIATGHEKSPLRWQRAF